MRNLKEGCPLELAEYAILHDIHEEPAFVWWVKSAIWKKASIVKKLKSKYWKTTHKFGVRLPTTVEEAKRIDQENSNHLWEEAIRKEMIKAHSTYDVNKYGYKPEDIRNGCA
jgi:hypothetical protein